MIRLNKYWTLLVLIISFSTIMTALIAENIFNMYPCQMCLYQRYPYYAIIVISFLFILLCEWNNKFYYLLIEILLCIGLFLSLWHVGIENNFLSGGVGCSVEMTDLKNINELKDFIQKKPVIACNEIIWSFLDISFAVYNSLLLVVMLVINSILLTRKND